MTVQIHPKKYQNKPKIHSLSELVFGQSHLFQFTSNSNQPTNIMLSPGNYKFDLWGASGYDIHSNFSHGSHVSGVHSFHSNQSIYLYPGEMGKFKGPATFNGGARGSGITGHSGGGSTDIRLTPGAFNDFSSLLSRIIVAGGGGGHVIGDGYTDLTVIYEGNLSCGGGLVGGTGIIKDQVSNGNQITAAQGGNQTAGGKCGKNVVGTNYPVSGDGSFGLGGNPSTNFGGGGGGGYFGGGGGHVVPGVIGSGGGGSSYVSGCDGCVSYSKDSTSNNMIPLESPIHYSGLSFQEISIHSGSDTFFDPYGVLERGHFGHGAILITLNSPTIDICHCNHNFTVSYYFQILISIIINQNYIISK